MKVPQDKFNNWHGRFGANTNIIHSLWTWNMRVFRGFRYRRQWDFPPNFRGSKTVDLDLFQVVHTYIVKNRLN